MKRTITILILLLAVITLSAQDITGKWTGAVSFTDQMGQVTTLRINFNISTTDDGYTSNIDSPDQEAYGLKVDSTFFIKPELTIKAIELNLVYVGNLVDDTNIKGTLTQHGQSFELDLKKETE
jgi:outer membrane protein assembly factor BamA